MNRAEKVAEEFRRMQDDIATLRAQRNALRKAFYKIGAHIAADPCMCDGGASGDCPRTCTRERLMQRFLALRAEVEKS